MVTDRFNSLGRPARYLGLCLLLAAVAFLVLGRWDLTLAVGAGALLGWVLLKPVRITWAIFVVAFMVPVTIDLGYPTNPSYTLLLLLFVLAVWGRLHRAERDGWPPRLIGAALLLPFCTVLAGVLHWHGIKPVAVGVAPLLCIGVLGWHLIEEARRDPKLILRIAETFTWISVAVTAFAKYQTLTGTWPLFDQFAYDWTYTSLFDPTRAAGLFGHPIVYGSFAMAMALVALTIRGRYWYIPFTANLVGLVLSGTRSAWVGTALALGIWLLLNVRRIAWRGVATGVVIAVVAFVAVAVNPSTFRVGSSEPPPTWVSPAEPGAKPSPSPATPPVDSVGVAGARMSDPVGSASASARFERISVAWDGITRDWSTVIFGNGPESNVRYLEDVGIGDGQAQVFDNTYLTIWHNLGLVGLLSFLGLLLTLFWRSRSLAGRLIMVGFAAQIFFFDVWLWLSAVAVLLLAISLGAAGGSATWPRSLRDLVPGRQRVPGRESTDVGASPHQPPSPSAGVAASFTARGTHSH
ncbi:O-antigen ligase family protein [Micromonospora sp. NPDC005215]|uniref:O-antigen ligase family protein n=1 Tax=Micromonospora sp. NPDC005215 TaxID=3157024 RepID=UPI0033B94DD8